MQSGGLSVKQNKVIIVIQIVLVLLGVINCFGLRQKTNQSYMPVPLKIEFTGAYSQNGGEWKELESDSDFSAFDGDLHLRLRMQEEFTEEFYMHLYLDHIGYRISLNDEIIAISDIMEVGYMRDLCGRNWQLIQMPGLAEDDEVEICLHNPHKYGNREAYNVFLDNMYCAPEDTAIIKNYLLEYSKYLKTIGIGLLAIGVMLTCAGMAVGFLKISGGRWLWHQGMLLIAAGGFSIFDTIDIQLYQSIIVINTYGYHLCLMLFAFFLNSCVYESVTGLRKKVMSGVVFCAAILDMGIIWITTIGNYAIYDTKFLWVLMQIVISVCMLWACIGEMLREKKCSRLSLVTYMILTVTMLLDYAGVGASAYTHGTCTKVCFLILFVVHLMRFVNYLAKSHHAMKRVRIMEKDLEDSRIAIMMSQIQPHFMYNVLNTIYYLCGHEPEKAREAISLFSDYLRKNMDALERKEPVLFEKELEHVKTYINLEKMRYEEDLEVIYQIEVTNFKVPVLSVQPLVENAVKHGISKKKGKGTLFLSTKMNCGYVEIVIKDDGIGFCPSEINNDNKVHVGIRNVEKRLSAIGATVDIMSVPGEGTTVVIKIPRKEAGLI